MHQNQTENLKIANIFILQLFHVLHAICYLYQRHQLPMKNNWFHHFQNKILCLAITCYSKRRELLLFLFVESFDTNFQFFPKIDGFYEPGMAIAFLLLVYSSISFCLYLCISEIFWIYWKKKVQYMIPVFGIKLYMFKME